MTGWTPDVSQATIIGNGMIQGAGLGFLFVPLSTVTLSTLAPEHRTEGAGLYNLSRNIGSSIGISAVTSLLTENTQANHADIAAARHGCEQDVREPDDRPILESTDRRGARRARCHDHAAGADHRLHR